MRGTIFAAILVCLLSNYRLAAQLIGTLVVLRSETSSLGVPVHPGPGDNHYSRWANGTIATVTARDSATGWYEVDRGGSSGWVVSKYITIQRPPIIDRIRDQSIKENSVLGPLPLLIVDNSTPAGSLTLQADSSNESLVPKSNVTFGGRGSQRTVTVTPLAHQSGSTNITVTVSDGVLTASSKFLIRVIPANKPPLLSLSEPATGGQLTLRISTGDPGQTNVVEASDDLVSWRPVSTNAFPATECAECPFILFLDSAVGSSSRFYRSINR